MGVEEPKSSWSINLSVLWTSPTITPCDMSRLARVLAEEIYQAQEEKGKKWEEETQEEFERNEFDLLRMVQSGEDEILIKEDLKKLGLIQPEDEDAALDTLDYFLRNSDIWDDSEEFDLLGTDSVEQDYYNYYY